MGQPKKKVHLDDDVFDIELKKNTKVDNEDSDHEASKKKLDNIEIDF